jgi:hypothetical protein
VATQSAALPILTAVYDVVGLRKLDARIAHPAPQRHVRDAAVLFLDDGRGDKILVIGKSRKKDRSRERPHQGMRTRWIPTSKFLRELPELPELDFTERVDNCFYGQPHLALRGSAVS